MPISFVGQLAKNTIAVVATGFLTACVGNAIATFDGPETASGPSTSPRYAVARVVPAGNLSWQMEVRTADGTVYQGGLLPAPAATDPPSPGGAIPLTQLDTNTLLQADVVAPDNATMRCVFRVLDAERGLQSGGIGVCAGERGRIDFIF